MLLLPNAGNNLLPPIITYTNSQLEDNLRHGINEIGSALIVPLVRGS